MQDLRALKAFTQVSEGKFRGTQHFAALMPIKLASRHLTPGLSPTVSYLWSTVAVNSCREPRPKSMSMGGSSCVPLPHSRPNLSLIRRIGNGKPVGVH